MRNILGVTLATVLSLGAFGCGGSDGPGKVENPSGKLDSSGNQVSVEAANKFNAAMKNMNAADKSGWSTEKCKQVAGGFLDAAEEQADAGQFFKEAHYNAGVAFQRCDLRDEARAEFEKVLDKDEKYHQARVQLALYKYADSSGKDIEGALSEMNRAIADSEYKNVEALVGLANLQMQRGNNSADSDGPNDFARAKKNIQRALAVNDGFMPAFNQLAVYYLETAKQKAGIERRKYARGTGQSAKADTQALELAALVCSQAIQKNPGYAPVHNTAGLIQVELENLNSAVASFNRARQLDKNFFEAHMNYASVNMKFRGFEQAAQAYQEAIRLRPSDYDANLGLALALRGQIDDSNFDKMLAAAATQLDKVKKLDPNRPEAYFNEAILTAEYKTKSGGEGANKHLEAAKSLFQQFVSKAGGDPEFADAVKDVTQKPSKTEKQCSVPGSRNDPACKKGRLLELDEIIEFNRQTAEMQKQMEQDMKQREAEEDAAAL